MSVHLDDLTGAGDNEMKLAMAQLAKAALGVLRLANPGKTFRGMFKEVPANRDAAFEVIGAGNTLFFRAGGYEAELFATTTHEEEEALLDHLLARRGLGKRVAGREGLTEQGR